MNPLIIFGGIGAVLAFVLASAKPAGAKVQKPGATEQPPADLMTRIKAAFEAADPAQLIAVANEAEARGFKAQADDLRAMAKTIETAVAAKVPVKNQPIPIKPIVADVPTGITSPGWPQPARTAPAIALPALPGVETVADPQRLLAGAVALHLSKTSRGREDKLLVSKFQAANQPEAGKVDGLYGPKTALVLARKYSIVPPKPFYWPKVNTSAVKRAYSTELMKLAMLDPPRFDEWSLAAKV